MDTLSKIIFNLQKNFYVIIFLKNQVELFEYKERKVIPDLMCKSNIHHMKLLVDK